MVALRYLVLTHQGGILNGTEVWRWHGGGGYGLQGSERRSEVYQRLVQKGEGVSRSIKFVWKRPVFEFIKYRENMRNQGCFNKKMTHRVGLSSGICI